MHTDRPPKPIIGLFASRDSVGRNQALARVLDYLVAKFPAELANFQFAVTRGTHRRVFMGEYRSRYPHSYVKKKTREFLHKECGVLRLPCVRHGGVVLLADLIVKRRVSTVWPFLSPTTTHWLSPHNLALLRLCDHCHVNRLMNEESVIEWASTQLKSESTRSPQRNPPLFRVGGINPKKDQDVPVEKNEDGTFSINWNSLKEQRPPAGGPTLALIAHNDMKGRIEDFTIDYQAELGRFKRLITTGTTGKVVQDAVPSLAGIVRRYNSGPKGGDIEIAAEMILKRCDVAVFLIDPLSAHPHSDDIKTLFGAAILNEVRLLTNERQARAWMDRTGGKVDPTVDYEKWRERKLKRGEKVDMGRRRGKASSARSRRARRDVASISQLPRTAKSARDDSD